jgi:hypothetical protein
LLLENGGSPVPTTLNPAFTGIVGNHWAINNVFISQRQFNFSQQTGGVSSFTKPTSLSFDISQDL